MFEFAMDKTLRTMKRGVLHHDDDDTATFPSLGMNYEKTDKKRSAVTECSTNKHQYAFSFSVQTSTITKYQPDREQIVKQHRYC